MRYYLFRILNFIFKKHLKEFKKKIKSLLTSLSKNMKILDILEQVSTKNVCWPQHFKAFFNWNLFSYVH